MASAQTHESVRVVVFMRATERSHAEIQNAILSCVLPSRGEEGNISYDAQVDGSDSLQFVVLEHWESLAARQQHLQSAHFKALSEAISGDRLSIHSFRVLRPLIAGSPG